MTVEDQLTELPAAGGASRVASQYAPQLQVCERLLTLVWRRRPRPEPSMPEYKADLLAILSRSLEIYDAVLALVREGRTMPALMLNRALFEDMVAAFWLTLPENQQLGPQRIRDQEDHIVLLSNDVIAKYPHRFLISPEEHAELETKRNDLSQTFGQHGHRTWFGDIHTVIGQIAPRWEKLGGEEETLRIYYAVVHRHINRLVHNTVSSITRGLERYDAPRSEDSLEIDVALRSAFFSLAGLALLVFDELGIVCEELIELEAESHTVFEQLNPKALANVGRNDPCPCGSGQKFKKCHGR